MRRPTASCCLFMTPRSNKAFLCTQTQQVFEYHVLTLFTTQCPYSLTHTVGIHVIHTRTQIHCQAHSFSSLQRKSVKGSSPTVHQLSSGKWKLRSCPPPSQQQGSQRRWKLRVTQGTGDILRSSTVIGMGTKDDCRSEIANRNDKNIVLTKCFKSFWQVSHYL